MSVRRTALKRREIFLPKNLTERLRKITKLLQHLGTIPFCVPRLRRTLRGLLRPYDTRDVEGRLITDGVHGYHAETPVTSSVYGTATILTGAWVTPMRERQAT